MLIPRMFAPKSPNSAPPTPQNFLGRRQLAIRWNCSVSTLKRMEKAGGLKPVRLGPRTLRYPMAQIKNLEN